MATRSEILELPEIPSTCYENIFNVYTAEKGNNVYYYYNITNKVKLPTNLSEDVFVYYRITESLPWPLISYRIYNDINLWWVIMLSNNIRNPLILIQPGTIIKTIKKEYINTILADIQDK